MACEIAEAAGGPAAMLRTSSTDKNTSASKGNAALLLPCRPGSHTHGHKVVVEAPWKVGGKSRVQPKARDDVPAGVGWQLMLLGSWLCPAPVHG